MFDLILQASPRIEIIQDIGIMISILIVGFLFFGAKTGARIFYLASGILTLFVGFAYIEESFMIFLSMLGVSLTIFIYTFLGGSLKS